MSRPTPDTSPHRHSWRVLHQHGGPTCIGCGANLPRIIEAERKGRYGRRERDDFTDRAAPFHPAFPMERAA